LEIMVLDDSTEDMRALAEQRTAAWRARGVNVRHVWRPHRGGYKAGALGAAFEQTSAEYIAIFDVDYRPQRDFLLKVMKPLIATPGAAFVQARLDYWNRNHSALTRAQAMQLDLYFAYEQAARVWAGVPTPFNGTGAVWRRAAIEDAGGWSARSLLEDLDISLRAFAEGWTSLHLMTVSVAGELPDTASALVSQRRRWAVGTGQSFRLLPWELLDRVRLDRGAVFSLMSLQHTAASIVVLLALASAVGSWVLEPAKGQIALAALLASVGGLVAVKTTGALLAGNVTRCARGRPPGWRFIIDLFAMWLLEASLVPVHATAHLRGLLQRGQLPFIHTPKKG
jgi:cellulose synthase/poly-beta-1,6-N-acetylglucosamine synthase-like glycosyltransferase